MRPIFDFISEQQGNSTSQITLLEEKIIPV
jgi:hypothetical protein